MHDRDVGYSMAEIDHVRTGQYPPHEHSSSPEFSPNPHTVMDIHFKLNGTDGVSLVADTLDRALQSTGCTVHKCSGDIRKGERGVSLPDLSYQTDEMVKLTNAIFSPDGGDARAEDALLGDIRARAQPIRDAIKAHITQNNIGTVVVRNLFSLPLNLPATVALFTILKDPAFTNVKFVLYHHDFYWESVRNHRFDCHYPKIAELIGSLYPPTITQENITHVVLNSLMQREMRKRYGINAQVIPDLYDFSRHQQETDGERPEPLRDRLGLGKGDLMIMVPTRVVPRKAIEFAIPLVAKLQEQKDELVTLAQKTHGLGRHERVFNQNSRIVLVLPQGEDLHDHTAYSDALRRFAGELGVELIFAGEHIRAPGEQNGRQGDARIPFYEVYREADVAVFPSVHEGFGNQLIEIVGAGFVPVVFDYDVLKEDIRLPHEISLGSRYEILPKDENGIALKTLPDDIILRATDEVVDMLSAPEDWIQRAEENRAYLASRYDAPVVKRQFLSILGLSDEPKPATL